MVAMAEMRGLRRFCRLGWGEDCVTVWVCGIWEYRTKPPGMVWGLTVVSLLLVG